MKLQFTKSLSILAISLTLFSCNKDDDQDPINTPDPDPSYTIPATYTFTDTEGNSTVNFEGQEDRHIQLTELSAKMKTANTAGTSVNAEDLIAMFANTGGNGNGNFSITSSKQLRDKCAVSFSDAEVIREEFESYMEALATISATTTQGVNSGAQGTAGTIADNGSGPYLVSATGMEYNQIITKGLMGAVFYDQIVNGYLSPEKIGNSVNNSDPVDPENGKYYTQMEHHWDEAFGYFTTSENFPDEINDSFWGKYSNTVDPHINSNEKLMNAFLKGRAAISNGDLTTKDEMAAIIKSTMEQVVAAAGIHYINSGISNLASDAKRNHSLSEGIGFIKSLRFGADVSLEDQAAITEALNLIGDDLYEVDSNSLTEAKNILSNAYGLNDVKDQL